MFGIDTIGEILLMLGYGCCVLIALYFAFMAMDWVKRDFNPGIFGQLSFGFLLTWLVVIAPISIGLGVFFLIYGLALIQLEEHVNIFNRWRYEELE